MLTSLEEYLRPNALLRPPRPCPELWTPPARSRGLRPISLRSKGSSRGSIVANNTRLNFESRIEKLGTLVFLARHDTADVIEQAPRVFYVDDAGERHEHIFDLLVIRTDGTRVATQMKPADRVKSSGIKRTLKLIAAQMDPDVADEVLLVTDGMLSRVDRFNAELLHSARRDAEPEDDAVIASLIADLKGTTRIAELVEASGLHGYGFRSVVRAIAAGDLRLVEWEMITRTSFVARPIREG